MVKLSANNMTIIVRAAVSFPGAVSSVADSVCARACMCKCVFHPLIHAWAGGGGGGRGKAPAAPLPCRYRTAPHRTARTAPLPLTAPLCRFAVPREILAAGGASLWHPTPPRRPPFQDHSASSPKMPCVTSSHHTPQNALDAVTETSY